MFAKKSENLIDYNDILDNVNYRIQFAKNGYLQWLTQKNEIINFFSSNSNKEKNNWFIEILFFLDFIKKSKDFRKCSFTVRREQQS